MLIIDSLNVQVKGTNFAVCRVASGVFLLRGDTIKILRIKLLIT